MSVSRVIIEQRLSDLEIALNRQEELIKTQKDALKNLRELIALEPPAVVEIAAPVRPLSAPVVPPAARPAVQASIASFTQPSNVGPVLAPPPPPKRDHQLLHGAPLPDPIAPAAKKPKIDSIITTSYPKRRRALDKVKQISGLFPPLIGREVGSKTAASTNFKEPLVSIEPYAFTIVAAATARSAAAANSFVSLARPAPAAVSVSSSSSGTQPKLQPGGIILHEIRALTTVHQRALALRSLEGRLQGANTPLTSFFNSGGKALFITWLVNLENLSAPSADAAELIDRVLRLFKKVEFTKAEVTSNRIDRVLRKLYKKFSAHRDLFHEPLLDLMRSQWAAYRALFKDGNGDDDGEGL